jgi:hypothetical protein
MPIVVWIPPPMTRVFPNEKPGRGASASADLACARNEVEAFQIAVNGDPAELNDLRVEASDLKTSDGERIPSERVDVRYAEYVPVHWHSPGNAPADLDGSAPGFYPDPLLPSLWRGVGRVRFPETVSAWIRIRVPADAKPGIYEGHIRVRAKSESLPLSFRLRVFDFALPECSHFKMTNWFLVGPILKFHKLEPLTPDFWNVIDIYAKNLADHRQNVILTPLFPMAHTGRMLDGRLQDQLVDIEETQPGAFQFDFANFDRWVELFFGRGFELIEGGHLAGGSRHPSAVAVRRGNEVQFRRFESTEAPDYRHFLSQFLVALRTHLRERNWLKQFVLHLSDEPHGDQYDAYASLSRFVRETARGIHLIDAMGSPEYGSFVDHPVPLESSYEAFVAQSGVPKNRIWFYYCCGPTGPWPNRFMDLRLIRVRIFTWLAFRYGAPGFLHWGLNHWNWHPPFYRAEEYNPYDNTTGGTLQAGDSYVLYPPRMPSESHEPVDSIRWEIIRKAMEDYEYLYLLREVARGKRRSVRAKTLLAELRETIAPDFVNHTRDERLLERYRRRVGTLLTRAL